MAKNWRYRRKLRASMFGYVAPRQILISRLYYSQLLFGFLFVPFRGFLLLRYSSRIRTRIRCSPVRTYE